MKWPFQWCLWCFQDHTILQCCIKGAGCWLWRRVSVCLSAYLPVHLRLNASLFESLPACLLVCFNLSACQLICHFKDFSACMVICRRVCVAAFLPVDQLRCVIEMVYSNSTVTCFVTCFFSPSNFYCSPPSPFTFYFLYLKLTLQFSELLLSTILSQHLFICPSFSRFSSPHHPRSLTSIRHPSLSTASSLINNKTMVVCHLLSQS